MRRPAACGSSTSTAPTCPADGATLGEVVLRGNNVMVGYYKDPEATANAAIDGWFRTGDVGVMHPNGYVELRDRAKDVIISGGENIASIEVEQALASHPSVLECAVVVGAGRTLGRGAGRVRHAATGRHRDRGRADRARAVAAGAVQGAQARGRSASCPKTGTGKIQKFVLREGLWQDRSERIGTL